MSTSQDPPPPMLDRALWMVLRPWDEQFSAPIGACEQSARAALAIGTDAHANSLQAAEQGVLVRYEAIRIALQGMFPHDDHATTDRAFRLAFALVQAAIGEAARQWGYPDAVGSPPWNPARDHAAFTPEQHERALSQAMLAMR